MVVRSGLIGALVLCAACEVCRAAAVNDAAAVESPLASRDQNPFLRPFYLPTPRLAGAEGVSESAILYWSNTVNLPHSSTEALHVDEETAELDLKVDWRQGGWLASVSLPLVWRGNGILDGAINDYHRLFGFSQGDRPRVDSNSYRISYQRRGDTPVFIDKGASTGNVPLEFGRLLYQNDGAELSAWTGLTLPTGDKSRGTGGAGFCEAAWLAGALPVAGRVAINAQVGVAHFGGSGVLTDARDKAEFGTLGITLRATSRLTAIAELDAHSGIARSQLNFLLAPIILAYGGRYQFSPTGVLEFGMQEDVATNRSPDVTLYVAIRSRSRRL